MLVCYEKDKCQKLIQYFTVRNKNLLRQQKIVGKEMPRLEYIKLYDVKGKNVYFPIGQFYKYTTPTKLLQFEFKYVFDEKQLPESMKPLVEEQQMIMDEISFEGRRSGLIEMKTGRGKGNLIIKLCEYFQEKTLILCHNVKTLMELKQKFMKFSNYEPGVYYSKKKEIKDITITTHASFVKKYQDFVGKFGILIVDEADTNFSKKMLKAIIYSDVDGIFGLTGTPYRQDLNTQDLTLIFGPHIKVRNQKNNGYNIIPEIVRILYENDIIFSYENRHDVKTQLMKCNKRLYKQIEFIKNNRGNLGLLLVDRIEECDMFYNALTSENIPTCIINGETDVKNDEINIQKMIEQKGIIVGTAQKIGRGVDIPQIDTIYLFYPCRFEGSVVQAVGRALRTVEGKTKAILYDRCDMPVLKGQAYVRLKTYQKEYPGCKITTLQLNKINNETQNN